MNSKKHRQDQFNSDPVCVFYLFLLGSDVFLMKLH